MNKKVIGIVAAAIVLILAIVIAVFALKGKEQGEVDNTINSGQTSIDNSSQQITDEQIDRIHEYTPNMTKDELREELNKELTPEEQAALNQIKIDTFIPDIVEVLPDEDPTDTRIQAVDANGTIYEIDDPFMAMTDEEAEAYIKAVKEEIARIPDMTDEDDGGRLTLDPNDFMENPRTPEYYIDQDLIDAGFEAEIDPDTGEITYINPNQVDDGTTGISNGSILSDPSKLTEGIDPNRDPWDTQYKPIYGGN